MKMFDSSTVLTVSDVGIAAEPLLNEALDEDKLENGGVGSFPIRWSVANKNADSSNFHLPGHK
jgi:hypothetical protein